MKANFRAWDKTTNQMRGCYGFNDMEREVYVCNVADDEFNGQLETVYTLKRSFDEVVLMQSSGVKDVNDKEIFEGDYLSIIVFESQKEYRGEVIFHKGSFCIAIKDYQNPYEILLHGVGNINYLLNVLGNVYENPELLEVME